LKIRGLFTKKNYLRYISHLDLIRLFHRSFNRSQIPIKYSEGFNPHPKFSISNPLSLGIESEGEYIDIELIRDIPIDEFITRMNETLPEDIQIIKAIEINNSDSISSIIEWAFYELKFTLINKVDIDDLKKEIEDWVDRDSIIITKLKKKGKNKVPKEVNIIPLIGNVVVKGKDKNGFLVINTLLKTGENGNLKPMEFIEAMNRDLSLSLDLDSIMIKRLALYAEKDDTLYSPL
jgi:radical SAM-linked protein